MWTAIRLNKMRYITLCRKNNNGLRIAMIILFALMVLCTFRPMDTIDTDNYYEYYLAANVKEPVPELSYVVVSIFWKNVIGGVLGFRCVMLSYYILTFAVLYSLLRKASNPLMSLLIFFSFAFSLQICIQVRAPLANMILLSSIEDIEHRKIKSHYLKIFFASVIHTSSIVFVVVYPALRFLEKYRSKAVMYGLPVFAAAAARAAASSIELIVNYGVRIGISGLERFSIYFLPKYYAERINPFNRISIILVLIYYSFLFFVGLKKMNTKEITYLIIIAYSIFFYFVGYYSIALIGYRFPESLNLILIFAIPALFKHIARTRNNRMVCYTMLFIYLILINNQYETIPTILSCLRLA